MALNKDTRLNKKRGSLKENLVAKYFVQKGWTILYQNHKFLGVEVDLIVKKNQFHMLIEVKSITQQEHLEKILKTKQKKRLLQVTQALSEDFSNLSLLLAVVNNRNKIEFFEIN